MFLETEPKSKSLSNFKTIRQTVSSTELPKNQADYKANPREAEMLRFFIVRNHYRSIQNYTPDNLADAQHALDRLYQTLQAFPAINATQATTQATTQTAKNGLEATSTDAIDWSTPAAQAFTAAMNDDFNTAGAVAVLFDLAAQANRGGGNVSSSKLSSDDDNQGMSAVAAAAQLRALGGVLGLLQTDPSVYLKSPTRYTRRALEQSQLARQDEVAQVTLNDEQIEKLIESRAQAKAIKDFKLADEIRAKLLASGVVLEDRSGGLTHWQRG